MTHPTTSQCIALRRAITAALPDASGPVLVHIARGLGLDVPGILAAADEPTGKRRHSVDAGKPMPRLQPTGLGWTPAPGVYSAEQEGEG